MDEYIKLYESDIKKMAATPAKGDFFDEDKDKKSVRLATNEADKFHHTTTKLLSVAKRVYNDINLAVLFLCTRVASPTRGDEDKLK